MDQVTGARDHSSVGATGSMASSTHSKHYAGEPVIRDQMSRVVGGVEQQSGVETVEWAALPNQSTTTTTMMTTTASPGNLQAELTGEARAGRMLLNTNAYSTSAGGQGAAQKTATTYELQKTTTYESQKAYEKGGYSDATQKIQHETQEVPGRSEQTRKVSSTIVESYALETPPADFERFVDEVVYEEQVTYKPVKETRVVERQVVKPVRKVVKVYKDVKPKPVIKKEVVMVYSEPEVAKEEAPEEVVVPRPVYYDVVKEVYVDELVYVDEPEEHYVDEPVEVIEYDDEEVPVIISQTVRPVITESPNSFLDVNVIQYEPEVIPVDVHVAKPVPSSIQAGGVVSSRHRLVNISSPQYNTILRSLNTHLDEKAQAQLPFTVENNVVKFVSEAENQFIIAPEGIEVEGYQLRKQPAAAYVHEEQVTALSSKLSRTAATNEDSAVLRGAFRKELSTTKYDEAAAAFVGSRAPSAVAESNVFQDRAAPKKREFPICCSNAQYSDAGAAHLSERASQRTSSSSSSSSSRNSSSQKPVAASAAAAGATATAATTTTTTTRPHGGAAPSRQPRVSQQGPSYYTRSATTSNAQGVAAQQGTRSNASSQRIETVHSYRSGMEMATRRSHVCC